MQRGLLAACTSAVADAPIRLKQPDTKGASQMDLMLGRIQYITELLKFQKCSSGNVLLSCISGEVVWMILVQGVELANGACLATV
jgi:hypothetical protein